MSVGTVSNAINRPDLVAPETRDRVQAAIERLGYVRSEAARSLRAGQSRIIGQLVLDMANPFFAEVAAGAARAAVAAGLRVMLCNSDNDPAEEAAYLSLFAEQRVRGVLLTPGRPDRGRAWPCCAATRSRSCWWTGSRRRAARCRSTTWRAGGWRAPTWSRPATG